MASSCRPVLHRRAVLLTAVGLVAAGPARAGANLFESGHDAHILADPRTGRALFGFDPVAYHVQQAAVPGLAAHEATLDGLVWRFRVAANKAAFEQDPAAYMPLFGGHDAAGVASGLMVGGDPEIFALAGGRVALFRDAAGRDRFAADAALRQRALASWPQVVRLHAGH
jgi:hypothetical protein